MPQLTRVNLQPAYILHQKPYRDSSALVELFTPEYGRVGVIVKGVKRAKSKWQGQLRAFQPTLVSWVGRGELMTLTHAEIKGQYLALPANCLMSGFYLSELLMRLTQRTEPQVEIFSHYDSTIRYISNLAMKVDSQHQYCENSDGIEKINKYLLQSYLRYFELGLLHGLGYGIKLDVEAGSGEKIQPQKEYEFHLDHGPVRLPSGIAKNEHTIIISGKTLVALAKQTMISAGKNVSNIDQQVFREAKNLMRNVLHRYLGDKPLKSRDMLSQTKLTN